MSDHHHPALPISRLIMSWSGALVLLWLLLLWKSIGSATADVGLHHQSQSSIPASAHAYVAIEPRFCARKALHFSSTPPSDHQAALVSKCFFTLLGIFSPPKTKHIDWLTFLPDVHRLQLATLNISRAPPPLH